MPDPVVLVGAVIAGVGVLAAILLPLTLLVPDSRGKTGFLVVPLAVAAFVAAWYAVVDTVASAGGFQNASTGFPPITLALAVPLAIGFAAAWLVKPIRESLLAPAIQPMLIAIQTYRIAGIGLVVLVALGQLPAVFGIPAGLGDFMVGLTAFSAAAAVKQGHPERAVWWNCLGLLDLVLDLEIERALHDGFGDHVSAAASQPYYLDVTHPQANKGAVARYLAEQYKLGADDIATIGDMPNDVLMFAHSGLSIAMGQSSPEVKRAARRVTTSNADEGFANAVERFILR